MRRNGKTHQEIADKLRVNEKTVRNDLETVYESENSDSYTVSGIAQNGKVKSKNGRMRPEKYRKTSVFARSQKEAAGKMRVVSLWTAMNL